MGQGACILLELWYNERMATTNNNASTVRTTNARAGSRRGPRPIQTVAQLKENLLRDALAKEIKKIDRKLNAASKRRAAAHQRADAATQEMKRLEAIRADFLSESNLAPKASRA